MKERIVVGVDGSAASRAALRWAIERAAIERRPVTAIEVRPAQHLLPATSYAPTAHGVTPPMPRTPSRLHEAVTAVRTEIPGAPTVTEQQLLGHAGPTLADAASGAAMLVLGHVPHARTADLLFGRVTTECLHRTTVPVVLVPHRAAK